MKLPDLHIYRQQFLEKGIELPLKKTPFLKEGLLKTLPKALDMQNGWPYKTQTNPLQYSSSIVWPKISIVTPSYNQAAFLEKTIRSVLLQNYPNLEYIIIDGGSTDNSIEILEKYAPFISYYQSEKDYGQSNAINLGFSLASGDYYAWINSDDFYLENVFNIVMKTFLTKKTEFIYGYSYNYKVSSNELELLKVIPFLDFFIRIPTLSQPSCFWKSNIHQAIWEDLHCSMDYELWVRMVKGKKRIRLKIPLSVAHVHEDAKTHDPKMKVKWQHDHELICSDNAHGVVKNWRFLIFLNNLFKKLF